MMAKSDTIFQQHRDVTLHMALRAEKRGNLKPVDVRETRKRLYLNGKKRHEVKS